MAASRKLGSTKNPSSRRSTQHFGARVAGDALERLVEIQDGADARFERVDDDRIGAALKHLVELLFRASERVLGELLIGHVTRHTHRRDHRASVAPDHRGGQRNREQAAGLRSIPDVAAPGGVGRRHVIRHVGQIVRRPDDVDGLTEQLRFRVLVGAEERVVHVKNAARRIGDRDAVAGTLQRVREEFQPRLVGPLLGDVDRRSRDVGQRAGVVEERLAAAAQPPLGAIRPDDPEFARIGTRSRIARSNSDRVAARSSGWTRANMSSRV
jgi:hypothetical protein